jgi:hypothetical protein
MTESREKLATSGPKASGMKLNKIIANHEYAGLAANPRPYRRKIPAKIETIAISPLGCSATNSRYTQHNSGNL